MNDRITIRIASDVRDALDRFHREQVPSMTSKQDVFRHIIKDWLSSHGYLPLPPDMRDAARLPPSALPAAHASRGAQQETRSRT